MMNKLCLAIILIPSFLSCNEENDAIGDRYLNNIMAGQDNGKGIHYVEYDPPINLVNSGSGNTKINLDMDNDEVDDFELEYLYQDSYRSHPSWSERLTIKPLGMNSICVSKEKGELVDSLKLNDTISSKSNWSGITAVLYRHWIDGAGGNPTFIVYTNGFWYQPQRKYYVGVKIVNGDNDFFGWIYIGYRSIERFAVTTPY